MKEKKIKKVVFPFYVPTDILKQVDAEAKVNGMSRNGFLSFLILLYFTGKLNDQIQKAKKNNIKINPKKESDKNERTN
jgi:hypothetical protein